MDGGKYVRSSYLWRDDLAGGGHGTTTEEGHLTVSIECGRCNWGEGRWIAGCTVRIGDGCLLPSKDDSSEDDLRLKHEINKTGPQLFRACTQPGSCCHRRGSSPT